MPNNENDLLTATQNIVEADDGTGQVSDFFGNSLTTPADSIVEITGKEHPLIDWDEFEEAPDLPVLTQLIEVGEYGDGTPETLHFSVRFDCWAPVDKPSLASVLADRLETILNYHNYSAEGLDVSVDFMNRNRNPAGLGRNRVLLTADFELTR